MSNTGTGKGLILNIETSTSVCSVSVARGGSILSSRESFTDRSHARVLTPFIEEVMKESGTKYSDLAAVAVSKGPGSYTGLRIGVSVAKGLCYGTGVSLIAIETPGIMASHVSGMNLDEMLTGRESLPLLLCPMIDARRMEVYTAIYSKEGAKTREVKAEIIDNESFGELLEKNLIMFFGDGANKCKDTIAHPHAIFLDNIYPSSVAMAQISDKAFRDSQFENVAYFEPFYLKDFVATTPRKMERVREAGSDK